jgi:predicted transposase/invertase (TIGR01784 family)
MNNENKDKLIRSSLDEPTKQAIKQAWNIDVDGEILSPLVDYIFKRIFTADETNSKKALIDFINSVLEHEEDDKIVDLTIVSAQIPVDKGTEKKSIFDIRAKYNNGRQAVIEMQKEATPGFKKRSQHIISRTYGSQEISGSDYDKLEKCYVICITNFNVIKKTTDYIKDYRFRDRQGNDLTDDETIVFLDLSKIEKVLTKPVDEITNVEKWAVFFKYINDESKRDVLNKILEGKEGIRMATNILLTVSKDEEARAQYESELRFQLDQNSRTNYAVKEALKQRDMEMAKNLLDVLDVKIIADKFNMTVEEVETLKGD